MACASGAADAAPASSGGSSVSCRFLLRSSLRISISLGAAAGKGSSCHSMSENQDIAVLLLGQIHIHRRTYGRIAVRKHGGGGSCRVAQPIPAPHACQRSLHVLSLKYLRQRCSRGALTWSR